jgi:hypothetical protein
MPHTKPIGPESISGDVLECCHDLSHPTAGVTVGLTLVKRNGGLEIGKRLPAQDSNMRTLAFSIVILKIKEWQDID